MSDRRIGIIGGSVPFLSHEKFLKGKIKETEQLVQVLKEEERIDLNPKPENDCSKGHRYINTGTKNHKEVWVCKHCERQL